MRTGIRWDRVLAGVSRLSTLASPGIALLALLWAGTAIAAEFHCADLKPSDVDKPPYERISGQMRCEGFYIKNVSQPFIELVSLTASTPSAQSDSVLQMRGSDQVPIQLVVHPLRPGPFYRMDALVEAAASLQWDAKPMLNATGLQLRDLGFLGLISQDNGILTVVPLAFTNASAERSRAVQGIVRASVPVKTLSWRRLRLDGVDDEASSWRDIPGPDRFAWERVPFAFDLPGDGRGVRVEVQAKDPDGNILPSLHFNVRSSSGAGN